MIRRVLALVVLLTAVMAVTGRTARAGDEEGWTPLFNGKDLSGWVPVNVDSSTFSVKEGLIACTGVPTGVMRTERMYENFIVECEWRHLKPGGNAGFFVWSDAITSKGVPFTRAVEVQVLDGPGDPQGRYTTHGDVFAIHGASLTPAQGHTGAFKMRAYPSEKRSKPSGQWNHYRIECRDGNISLSVNGAIVTRASDASPRKGYICLESEGGQVEWRNIRIRELQSSDNLDEKQVARKDEGLVSIYNGIDLDGWQTSKAAESAWRAKDWILHYEPVDDPQVDGQLRSKETFVDMDLVVDVRSAAAVELLVRGRPLKIEPIEPGKAAWRRAVVSVREWTIVMTVDDQRLPAAAVPADFLRRATPIAIKPAAAADVANVYVKRVSRPAAGDGGAAGGQ